MKPRLKCETDLLLDAFQLHKIDDHSDLNQWLSASYELPPARLEMLEKLRLTLNQNVNAWNEEELKVKFIGLLIYWVDFEAEGQIKTFFERPLMATIGKHHLSVKTDLMIAEPLGIGTPKVPYFFLQEFKKEKGENNDPEGQMLAAMLIAQQLNQQQWPIYGGYVIGRNWFFTILKDKTYIASNAFNATKQTDLLKIFYALCKLKEIILNQLLEKLN